MSKTQKLPDGENLLLGLPQGPSASSSDPQWNTSRSQTEDCFLLWLLRIVYGFQTDLSAAACSLGHSAQTLPFLSDNT